MRNHNYTIILHPLELCSFQRRRVLFSFTVYRSQIGDGVAKLHFFGNVAFNLLSQLVNRPLNDEEDEESLIDDIDEEIREESDVECDEE